MTLLRNAATAVLLAGAAVAQANTSYNFQTITPAGAEGVTVLGINNLGQIVGDASWGGVTQGFVLQGKSVTQLAGPAGALGAFAADASENGYVVGNYWSSTTTDPSTGDTLPGPNSAFVYNSATASYSTFNIPGASDMSTRGVSPDGRFVSGFFYDDSGMHGFVYDTTGALPMQVVGGPSYVIPQGINSAGTMVGSERVDDGTGHRIKVGFTYDVLTGARTNYSFAGYVGTNFRDIASDGTIAGWLATDQIDPSSGMQQMLGFVGTPASFQVLQFPGAWSTAIEGINDKGWLVGNYTMADGTSGAFLATPVPEPATAALALGGLLGLVGLRRRQQAKA
jgi:uncharacterized membrane protein